MHSKITTRSRFCYVRRHRLAIRITHWVNFGCMAILLMSGLGIFNGWPALYWGQRTHFASPLLAMYELPGPSGQEVGKTDILGRTFTTTGWLGVSRGEGGGTTVRGFPSWATIPGPVSLALSRRWHFFFAWIFVINGAIYVAYSLLAGHLWRDLVPSLRQLRHFGRSLWDHARLRFPRGEEAREYNVLQRLAYLVVAFGMGPLIVATGLAMSPWMDAAWPPLVEVFGGRQSARTIHFVTAFAFLAFFLVHVLMVLLSGVTNNLRSMITGRYRIELPGAGTGGERDE